MVSIYRKANMANTIYTENLPREMTSLPQWVCWKREKDTKVPCRCDGKGRASSTDPATWAKFDDAVYGADDFDGVGFVTCKDCGIILLDLDHCIDADGEVGGWAKEILSAVNSCTEISPSGRGYHCYFSGKLPGPSKKAGDAEIYDCGRYFTVTGRADPNYSAPFRRLTDEETARAYALVLARKPEKPGPANPITAALPIAQAPRRVNGNGHDLLERMFSAKNGAAIQALYNGDTSAHGGDDSAADMALCAHLAFWTARDALEIDRLFRQSKLYRDKWDRRHSGDGRTYGQMTVDKAIEGCVEAYGEKKVLVQTEAAPIGPAAADNGAFTDAFAACWFSGLYADRLRFDHTSGHWHLWDSRRWVADETGRVYGMAVEAARGLLRQIREGWDPARVKALLKFCSCLENRNKIRDILELASHAPGLAVTHQAFDSDRMLFNCLNGTIALRTGAFYPHTPENMITKISPAAYEPGATCPKFDAFLQTIFAGDAEIIGYIARCFGLFLTGLTDAQVMFFWYGLGANGKSVLVNAFMGLLGDYGMKAPSNFLMLDKGGSNSNDVARLRGARLVVCAEIQDGARLNESLTKDLTGGDRIAARFLHREFFEFEPEFKILIIGNHKPAIRGTDLAVWRRLHLTPFSVTIPENDRRPMEGLLAGFRDEMSGILNFCLAGLNDFQRGGLRPPASVTAAVSAYRNDSDILGRFLEDCTITDRKGEVVFAEFYAFYAKWCASAGEHPVSGKRLAGALDERGYGRRRTGQGKTAITGLVLVQNEVETEKW